jgi:TIR domain
MKPGDRIELIRDITDALTEADPWDIDLILNQHGFRTAESSRHPRDREYVIWAVETATDEELIELNSYLNPGSRPEVSRPQLAADDAKIWKPRFHRGEKFARLFLSHTHAHQAEIGQLKIDLLKYGVAGFVAHQDILPTREWASVIESALKTCHALAAYLTPDFHESSWTDQEVGAAVARDVLILPIKVGRDPYGFISKYQAVQGKGVDPLYLAMELAGILRSHRLTKHIMANAAVDRFVHSEGWNEARENLKLIQQLPRDVWTPELVAAIRSASSDNDEVRTADLGFGQTTVSAAAIDFVDSLANPPTA